MCPSSTSSSKPAHAAIDDGLIPVRESAINGRAHRVLASIIVVLFFGLLTGTGLIDTFFPISPPELIGWEAEEEVERKRNAKFSDGSLASLIEHDRRLTSWVRQQATSIYSRALYKWVRFGNGEVIIGRDGWIFLRARVQQPNFSIQETVELASNRLAALDRVLAMRGTKLLVVPVPRKCTLYPEFLPLGVDPVLALDEQFEPALLKHGIPFAAIHESFAAYTQREGADTEDPLYFKVGSHWTRQGELIAAREVGRASGMWKPSDELPTTITSLRSRPQENDLLAFAGIESESKSVSDLAGAADVAEWVVLDDNNELVPRTAAQAKVGAVALAGTSFSARRHFSRFIGHFIQKPVYNAAIPGANPISSITALLEKSKPGFPKLLVLELPNHYALLFENLDRMENLLSAHYPPGLHALTPANHWWFSKEVKAKSRFNLNRRVQLSLLKPGVIAHTGDGLLAVRVRGKLLGNAARISIQSGAILSGAKLVPRSGETVIPLILPATSGESLRVFVSSNAKNASFGISADAIELVATFDPSRAWPGETSAGNGEETLVEFDEFEVVPHFASFVLKLKNKKPVQRLQISGEFDGKWSELGVFSDLAARAQIFVSLRTIGGKTLTRIKVAGVPVEDVAETFIAPLLTREQ